MIAFTFFPQCLPIVKQFRSQYVRCLLGSKTCCSKIYHDELRKGTVALNPGRQRNCATCCGNLRLTPQCHTSIAFSLSLQHRLNDVLWKKCLHLTIVAHPLKIVVFCT